MMCCSYNCNQGRSCPIRKKTMPEWLDTVGRCITVLAAAVILGYVLGWVVAPIAVGLIL